MNRAPKAITLRDAVRALPAFSDATVSVFRGETPADDSYRVTTDRIATPALDAVLSAHGLRREFSEITGGRWDYRHLYVCGRVPAVVPAMRAKGGA